MMIPHRKVEWNDFGGEDWICKSCGTYGSFVEGERPEDSSCSVQTEEEFLRDYNLHDYPAVGVTVDLNIFTIRNNTLSVLLIERGGHPFKDKWALPGGFVNQDEELDTAAMRELQEETGISWDKSYIEQLKTYGSPGRDPRGYIVSTTYVALIPNVRNPIAGSDATRASFIPVEEALNLELAFDHKEILKDGVERIRAKMEYSTVAFNFIEGSQFTLTDLRRVYEIVWNCEITPSNFRRKILSVPNLVDPVGKATGVSGPKPPVLYTRGSANKISPPLNRCF